MGLGDHHGHVGGLHQLDPAGQPGPFEFRERVVLSAEVGQVAGPGLLDHEVVDEVSCDGAEPVGAGQQGVFGAEASGELASASSASSSRSVSSWSKSSLVSCSSGMWFS